MASAADKALNASLDRFRTERSQARKFHPESIGRDVDPNWCFGDFLCRIQSQDRAGLEKVYGSVYKAALNATVDGTTGGYLVPVELRYELMIAVAEAAIVRPRATVLPMKSLSLKLPVYDTSVAGTANQSPFFGGFNVSWTEESATRTEDEPQFRQVVLTAKELSCQLVVSNNMLNDGGQALESYLKKMVARAIAWQEDLAFLQGTGAGQPLGLINAAATLTQTRQVASKFQYVDAAGMLKQSWTYDTGCWAITKSAVQELYTLVDGSGRSTWTPNAGYGQDSQHLGLLFGMPLYATEKLPALGTKGDVLLFSPTLYVIGDRQEVTIDASTHPYFLQNQTVWRVLERVDGQPWYGSSIQLQNNTQTVSPYVVLN